MNDKRRHLDTEADEIYYGAHAIRAHGDAILDGTHRTPEIPDEYGYAFLALAGWLETEADNLNGRTRPYALAIVRSFIFGDRGTL